MPYVNREVREEFADTLDPILRFIEDRGIEQGELNYLVTRLMIASLADVVEGTARFSYNRLSAIHACVHDAADEFKRRLIDPYENAVISKNGDLYDALEAKVPPMRPKEETKP